MKAWIFASALALGATAAAAQPAAPMAAPVAPVATVPAGPVFFIHNGAIHTVGAAGTISGGDVIIAGGKIAAVGRNLTPPPGAITIDARGKPVTPGLMASATQLSIQEIQLGAAESNDSSPDLTTDTAAFDVADAINPNSTLIPVARIAGVTRSLVTPVDGAGVFFGQAAVIHLGNGPDILVKRAAGQLVRLEPLVTTFGPQMKKLSRPDLWALFRETLDDARDYWAQRAAYHKPGGYRDQRTFRIDLEALGPVIQGQEPLIVHVDRASDIRQAVQYAQANKLKLVIFGAEEGWMVAKLLADAHVPVIIDPDLNLPDTFSDLGATLKNAALLDKAGVTVIFQPQADDPSQYARTITQIAGNAVANGMPWDHALAAITKNPAEVFGIGDQYGTLDAGKDADVVIWDGDPLEVTSAPTAVFIRGVRIPLVSRQTLLRDRYRNLGDRHLPFAYR